ncbi:unnamed protein product (macronuclear) [Paramecium tetraurelia]|uniref:Uncharacterized protein n=1 Tax=Paramecium tetraurelia TaxID=5888 RepID=A0BHR9_PARTE|nr:uncharacterized protein GSPATT00029122001 [Paramecium tetraurelia]CAK58086.1 unnamed protein product [Paramecium tetraurelia]|eukprot:XP_001425484.1 hypothetical protein (macronuclear) [Paramecium tetraurelia strain d4-2]
MNKIRTISRNIATMISKSSLNQVKRTQIFKNLTKNQDFIASGEVKLFQQQCVQEKITSPIADLQNIQYKLFKQSIRHGLSELVRIDRSQPRTHKNINYAGDYESKFVHSHFIHALYLNRIGANDYYFTVDDLKTTQSEYHRT